MDEAIFELANCRLTRYDLDDDHFYYGQVPGKDPEYYLTVTQVLDLGAPFPEGLRQYLRVTSYEEQKERLEITGARGTKLHDAIERLARGERLDLAAHSTKYEKDALTTFVSFMRFLVPDPAVVPKTELKVADTNLRVAGTLDWKGYVESWKLTCLLNPTKYLELDSDGDIGLKEQFFDMVNTKTNHVIIDWKFTGRTAYSHKVQAAAYRAMHKMSYPERPVSRAFCWRYSPRHKFGFDFQEATYSYDSFKRIYDTAIEYLGDFPAPKPMKAYPRFIQLYETYSHPEQLIEKGV